MAATGVFSHRIVCTMIVALVLTVRAEGVTVPTVRLTTDLSIRPSHYLTLSCSLDHAKAASTMATVNSLSIFGPRPSRHKQDLEALATVSIWNPVPQLMNGLSAADADLTGFFASTSEADNCTSELVLSWKLPLALHSQSPLYRCSAQGTNTNGQATSVSDTIQVHTQKVDASNTCDVSEKLDILVKKLDEISNNASLSDTERKVTQLHREVSVGIQGVKSRLETQQRMVEANALKIDKMEQSVAKSVRNISGFLLELQETVRALSASLAASYRLSEAHEQFEVSPELRGKRYLLSKKPATFNINNAQMVCEAYGGYLLEVDDKEEYQFVIDFARSLDKSGTLMTGANDIEKENHFVYFYSKKPVPVSMWRSGEPNDYGHREDCVALEDHFNDVRCDSVGRYVCEVQF